MAITPSAGYQVDPNNPNGVIPINTASQTVAGNTFNSAGAVVPNTPTGNAVIPTVPTQQPAAQAPAAPVIQPQTPAAPATTVNVNTAPAPATTPQNTAQPTTGGTDQTNSALPTTGNLAPGSQGQDVQQLQNWLVQMGYLTPDQVATGAGTYGPQTTAAVAKLQQDLGLNPSSGKGSFGPQTQQALAQKYQSLHQQVQGSQVPDNSAQASAKITSALTPQGNDPVFGSMASMMEPIMNALTQVVQNINNPALTGTSLQSEYNQLAAANNLLTLQAEKLNMVNIMNGSEQDIRDEITKAGGFATDSQVLGMAASRNKVILKQYNAISTQYDAASQNVQNMMQYASQDQQTALQRQQMTASITTNLASVETQMIQMGMTMQNNARSAAQNAVTNMGYTGLAASAQGNPQMLSYYENVLGLAPGALSNPTTLAGMDTYKNQQLQINNYRAAISAYSAGYGGGGLGGGTGGGTAGMPGYPAQGQVGVTPVDPVTLVRPSYVNNNVPLTMTADQMTQYMGTQKAASVDPGTHNVVAPGIGYYMQQADGSYVLKAALPSPTDTQYSSIKQTMDSAGVFSGSPSVTRKWTLSANSAISSFKDTGTYKIASNVAPYLAAIHAAAVNPGDKAISDFELLDSFVKAAKGGTGQVTDSQINVMLHGASINDSWNILQQKLGNGGVLAPAQRQAIITLADETYKRNLQDYQKGYVQAVQAMQAQGIPPQFWRNLPDFTSLEPTQ